MKRIKRMHFGREVVKEVDDLTADRLISCGWEEVKPKKKAKKKTDKAETATKKKAERRTK